MRRRSAGQRVGQSAAPSAATVEVVTRKRRRSMKFLRSGDTAMMLEV
ncbi:hypothetical protein [Lysobacter gummosus]